jgi:hypothetical protein
MGSSEEVSNAPHTDKEIEQAAARFEKLADSLDPDNAKVEDTEAADLAPAARAISLRQSSARRGQSQGVMEGLSSVHSSA